MDTLYKSEFRRQERVFSKKVSHKQEEQRAKLEEAKELLGESKDSAAAGRLGRKGNSLDTWLLRFQKKAAFGSLFN